MTKTSKNIVLLAWCVAKLQIKTNCQFSQRLSIFGDTFFESSYLPLTLNLKL